MNKVFWKKRRVLVTGHTGFKGTWLCEILSLLGAEVHGYALGNEDENTIYNIILAKDRTNSCFGDIRDFERFKAFFDKVKPEVVFHLAAQPLVRESYREPRYTYETNVMGTVNLLECVRLSSTVKSVVNVTTDKVYENADIKRSFVETDILDGYDPYSNSKSCSELVTHSYIRSFFKDKAVAVSTARAGNVIGGGDFAKDRIVPDCVRAAMENKKIILRNPYSVRPYQHVLEPLGAYLEIAEKQYYSYNLADSYNVGPNEDNCIATGTLADIFCQNWTEMQWEDGSEENAPHEAGFLMLDCTNIREKLGWKPKWNIDETVKKTVEWYQAWCNKEDMLEITRKQIKEHMML